MIIYECDKCEHRFEWNYLNLPSGWKFQKEMDADGGHTDLWCNVCLSLGPPEEYDWDDSARQQAHLRGESLPKYKPRSK